MDSWEKVSGGLALNQKGFVGAGFQFGLIRLPGVNVQTHRYNQRTNRLLKYTSEPSNKRRWESVCQHPAHHGTVKNPKSTSTTSQMMWRFSYCVSRSHLYMSEFKCWLKTCFHRALRAFVDPSKRSHLCLQVLKLNPPSKAQLVSLGRARAWAYVGFERSLLSDRLYRRLIASLTTAAGDLAEHTSKAPNAHTGVFT